MDSGKPRSRTGLADEPGNEPDNRTNAKTMKTNTQCEQCELAKTRVRELHELNASLSLGLDDARRENEKLKAMLFSKRDAEGLNQTQHDVSNR